MSIKTRLERLEQAGPVRLKDPREMTNEEIIRELAQISGFPLGHAPTDEELMALTEKSSQVAMD